MSDEIRDVVVDFIISKWPGSRCSAYGSFIEIQVGGKRFVFFFENAGIRSSKSYAVFNYDEPLLFENLVEYLEG